MFPFASTGTNCTPCSVFGAGVSRSRYVWRARQVGARDRGPAGGGGLVDGQPLRLGLVSMLTATCWLAAQARPPVGPCEYRALAPQSQSLFASLKSELSLALAGPEPIRSTAILYQAC